MARRCQSCGGLASAAQGAHDGVDVVRLEADRLLDVPADPGAPAQLLEDHTAAPIAVGLDVDFEAAIRLLRHQTRTGFPAERRFGSHRVEVSQFLLSPWLSSRRDRMSRFSPADVANRLPDDRSSNQAIVRISERWFDSKNSPRFFKELPRKY
jgi:hypothetical protein